MAIPSFGRRGGDYAYEDYADRAATALPELQKLHDALATKLDAVRVICAAERKRCESYPPRWEGDGLRLPLWLIEIEEALGRP